MENSSLVPQPPAFPRGFNRILADSVLAAPAIPSTAPAGVGQNMILPAPAQLRTPHLGTAALDINPSTAASHRGSVRVGTDNVSPTTFSPEAISRTCTGGLGFFRYPLLSFGQLREEPRPTVILARLCSRLHLSYLELLRLARLLLSRRILSRQEHAGVAPPSLDPRSPQSVNYGFDAPPPRPATSCKVTSRHATPSYQQAVGALAPHREARQYLLFGPRHDRPVGHRRG